MQWYATVTTTFKSDVQVAFCELVAFKNFAKATPFPLFRNGSIFGRFAKRERVICVCFLRVVVRPNLIHPNHNLFAIGKLQMYKMKEIFRIKNLNQTR